PPRTVRGNDTWGHPMIRTTRRILVSTLVVLLVSAAASLAAAGSPADPGTNINKAQVEYHERLQLDTEVPSGFERNKAYVEYQERQPFAERPHNEPLSAGPAEEVEQLERERNADRPDSRPVGANSAQSAAGWQLALTALAGALIGGLAVTGARRRREHVATPGPDLDDRLRV
ncbi:MAG TPA: hypothetical protein VK925_12280, partial [Jiangellaceae bacterium]|nr:hypothetical protein [Jiangellaceae bacterium]